MTIGCTRCGASEDGEIISPPIAFAFKHNKGCAHGIGPLAVLPSNFKKSKKDDTPKVEAKETKSEVKVEKQVKENKPEKSKSSSFSEKE